MVRTPKKKIGQKNRKKKEEKRNYPFAHKVDLHYVAIHKKCKKKDCYSCCYDGEDTKKKIRLKMPWIVRT